ncbi:UNVERIFIED_CONTAM: Aspartic proteinase CDR1 [Sesamum radiatum]|uniref:Aspartic proteinase CDR1 n=1 Tax=Sesamum radiatum TaxID=300843 RepID=A0AAW2MFL2_SESRA
MAIYYEPLSLVLATLLLLLSSIFLISLSEATKNCGVTLDLIHRESPLSPSYDPSITHFERSRNLFRRSISRHSALTSASFKSASKSPDSFEGTLTPIGGEYLIKISIGTLSVEILAIADTDSDLTWTHNGDLAVETFAFDSSTSNGSVVFPKVVFGCGHNNDGTFNETGSGIGGLGGGTVSIVRQLETTIGGKFSYCLTTLDSNSSSKISFGPHATVIGPKVSSTPIVQKSPDTFYYLTLEGVSVGNEALAYNYIPNFNSKASFEEGNIIIDFGTTLTFLPSSLYKGVDSTLEKSISGNRVSDPQGLFGLCYELLSQWGI